MKLEKAILTRIGESLSATLSSNGRITASLAVARPQNAYGLTRFGGLEYGLARPICRNTYLLNRIESAVNCELTRAYDEVGEAKYLEIEPTVLWVYPDLESMNDVYSNTKWNIK